MSNRRVRLLAIVSIAVLCGACGPFGVRSPAGRVAPQPTEVAWDDRTHFAGGLIRSERPALERLAGATVYHIDLLIPAGFFRLEGSEQVRYTNQEDVALNALYFRLYPNVTGGKIEVSALRVDGQEATPAYEFADSAMRVPLPEALQPGQQAVVEMNFAITVPLEMGGNYGLFGYLNDVLVLDTFYPAVAAYDDDGWGVSVPPRNGDLTYYDASLYLVRVTVPRGVTVVASGVEIGREYDKRTQIVTFAAGPARDFYIAASDRYIEVSQQVGETTVHSYAFKERREQASAALQVVVQALESYNARLGTYPYTELDVLSTPMTALGIEYPGAVGISLKLYDPDAVVSGLPSRILLESVVAHEVAHQWFYNAVGNDQVEEPWLDEAIVQYVVGLYYADTYGESAAQSYRSSWEDRWDGVGRAEIPIGLPTGAYESSEYSAIVYGRGPLFVAALAEEMGQETFDAFLRDYYQSFRWGIGTGDAFRALAEEHCRCDLSALFDEWVYPR